MNYYNEIKQELINNEINRKVKKYSINKSDLTTYYKVGKILSEAGKHYGEGIIKKYSILLTNDVDKKYNTTTLKRMRQFYHMIEKGAPLGYQLSWSHYREVLSLKDINAIKYYLNECVNKKLTVKQLQNILKSKEYDRLTETAKDKLIQNKEY